MSTDPEKNLKSGVQITLFGMAANLALCLAKFSVGLLTGSISLITDGLHSLSDLAGDLVVLGGLKLGAKPPDESHPYGHGRFETLAGGVVALLLIGVGLGAAWKAGADFYDHVDLFAGWPVLVTALGSIGVKEWLFRKTIEVARRERSVALHANAWHHRSDALSSVAVLGGGVAGTLGWGHGDQVAGIVVGLMITASGGMTLVRVLKELTEGALGCAEVDAIKASIEQVPRVQGSHCLRTKLVGREVFIDVHVLVAPDLPVLEAHDVSMQVETAVQGACSQPVNVLVHIEPDTPELRDHHGEHGVGEEEKNEIRNSKHKTERNEADRS